MHVYTNKDRIISPAKFSQEHDYLRTVLGTQESHEEVTHFKCRLLTACIQTLDQLTAGDIFCILKRTSAFFRYYSYT